MPRSHRSMAQTGWFPSKPCKQELWNHPACSAFLEFDGLAGTPPNLGGEFQTPNCQFIHTFSRVATFCCRSAALIGCASRDILDSTGRRPPLQLNLRVSPGFFA